MKDTAMIKLFGKTIPIVEIDLNRNVSVTSSSSDSDTKARDCSDHDEHCSTEEHQITDKDSSSKELVEDKQELVNSQDLTGSSGISENPKTPPADKETNSSLRSSKNGEQQGESTSEKTPLKKPDKILSCPRCNSKETKFCYYNNYNVSQPRHFCKNCQRYWTSGGTMRNVPVGAGRRKNKNSSTSQYHQLIVSEAIRTAQICTASGVCNSSARNNAIVLRFGSDSPLCETGASILTMSEKSKFFNNRDDRSCGSSITGSNSSEIRGLKDSAAAVKNCEGLSPYIPSISGNSWMPYPLNSPQWHSAVPTPVFSPPGFPMTFFPAPTPYVSYAVPTQCLSPTINNSILKSPILGKHSREENLFSPTEISKNLVWSGRSEKMNLTTNGVGMFDGIQSKGSDKFSGDMKSTFMHANPAAMLRSVRFRESS